MKTAVVFTVLVLCFALLRKHIIGQIKNYLNNALTIEKLTISISDLHPTLQNLKIIQLSDFHFVTGNSHFTDELRVKVVNSIASIDPDVILLTGDFIDNDPAALPKVKVFLEQLKAPLGIFAVLGNHDHDYGTPKRVVETITSANVTLLNNEVRYLPNKESPHLAIVGLGDLWYRECKPENVMPNIPNIPRVVMSHNPDSAELLKPWKVDLQLSGHTHGGQIRVPFLGALLPILKKVPFSNRFPRIIRNHFDVVEHWEWALGLHEIPRQNGGINRLYVNRGIGTAPPIRIFCSPELTMITLIS
jgi:hypothetical protein